MTGKLIVALAVLTSSPLDACVRIAIAHTRLARYLVLEAKVWKESWADLFKSRSLCYV